jgi:hypothetical protein
VLETLLRGWRARDREKRREESEDMETICDKIYRSVRTCKRSITNHNSRILTHPAHSMKRINTLRNKFKALHTTHTDRPASTRDVRASAAAHSRVGAKWTAVRAHTRRARDSARRCRGESPRPRTIGKYLPRTMTMMMMMKKNLPDH